MSQGIACKCPERNRPLDVRRWVVLQRNANCSAFNGYRRQCSDYSSVQCHSCGHVWRTKANYVYSLKDGQNVYDLPKTGKENFTRILNEPSWKSERTSEPCEKCNTPTIYTVDVGGRRARWCGCGN